MRVPTKVTGITGISGGPPRSLCEKHRAGLGIHGVAAAIRSLSSNAEKLNEFHNNIVHWRPFVVVHGWKKQSKFTTATSAEIEAKSVEMDKIGTQFFARAIYFYKGDGSPTFGTHIKGSPTTRV